MRGAGGGTRPDMARMNGELDLNSVDRILDRTVALGYGWPGYVARRRRWPADPAPDSLVDQRVLITVPRPPGSACAAAARCAALGATVHLLGHNTARATEALQWLAAQVPAGRFELELCDLQSLADVRRFADDFATQHDLLDALAHNAGVYSEHRQETPEGTNRTQPACMCCCCNLVERCPGPAGRPYRRRGSW